MKTFIILLSIFFNTKLHAWEDDLSLKAGASLGRTMSNSLKGEEDDVTNYGFITSFGYKWTNWDIGISNHIYFGKVEGLTFQARGADITGTGRSRVVGITPNIQYLFNVMPKKNWRLYVGAGPTWSLQSVKLKSFQTTGDFKSTDKLTYESYGWTAFIGVAEQTLFKEMHPVFIDITYTYNKSHELSVVDTSEKSETNILSSEERKQDITNHTVLLNMGIAVF